MASSVTAPTTPVDVRAGVVYPLETFMRITGFGRHAMRAARRRGLKVHYTGNRAFVRGDDFLSYLDSIDRERERS